MSESEKNPKESAAEYNGTAAPEAVTKTDENVTESIPETDDFAASNNSAEAPEIPTVDYAELDRADMRELCKLFPHLRGKESVAELENPLRYAALRDLGLTPKEAYLATNSHISSYDNRSHLQSAVPRPAGASQDMLDTKGLEAARELFAGLSDREIQRLYKKVSK